MKKIEPGNIIRIRGRLYIVAVVGISEYNIINLTTGHLGFYANEASLQDLLFQIEYCDRDFEKVFIPDLNQKNKLIG
tara:strand:+ start:1617 stop:1847 length:231 start_codon:yes stop_codon:yes gene_type:complete